MSRGRVKQVCKSLPLALYSDRHAVFKYVPGSHQSPAPTQFGRAMAELGVEQIFARSPEAKGRVERANGTFQDRLVTELRLAGARTISEANQVLWAFLTRFNKRFGVPPAQSTNAYRSPDPDLNLAGIAAVGPHLLALEPALPDPRLDGRGRDLRLRSRFKQPYHVLQDISPSGNSRTSPSIISPRGTSPNTMLICGCTPLFCPVLMSLNRPRYFASASNAFCLS